MLLTVLGAALLITSAYYFAAVLAHTTIQDLFGKDACYFNFFSTALLTTLASTTLAMSIKLTKNWIETKRHKQLLDNHNDQLRNNRR